MAKIERNPGILVQVGSMCALVGAGYEGKTKELDQVVQTAAKVVAKHFKRDVEIRFNCDRESGGAWIKDHLKADPSKEVGSSLSNSCQVGLNAGLRAKFPNGLTYKQWCETQGVEYLSEEARRAEDELPREIYHQTYIAMSVLKKGIAEQYPENDEATYHRYNDCLSLFHESQEVAFAWLKANVDPKKIKR